MQIHQAVLFWPISWRVRDWTSPLRDLDSRFAHTVTYNFIHYVTESKKNGKEKKKEKKLKRKSNSCHPACTASQGCKSMANFYWAIINKELQHLLKGQLICNDLKTSRVNWGLFSTAYSLQDCAISWWKKWENKSSCLTRFLKLQVSVRFLENEFAKAV